MKILATLTWLAMSLTSASLLAKPEPNMILILVDDLGYGELGCYGNDFNETPHIDQLASEGVRYTQAYTAASVCSPTRASIMTGLYPARTGINTWLPPAEQTDFGVHIVNPEAIFNSLVHDHEEIGAADRLLIANLVNFPTLIRETSLL